ncbi:MFS transporter [Kitasatospora viridis]|uniref:Putative MFS family arabinose efflux permease n=1 Tax=Kitasatospora viridis TaxID=281105 RepID=A0A561SEF2_9ACTN|nr:MFS transporter [Kitasatospora viridis]TWF73242.1 putative MFS family arabinose efflux permease [Kitasatospora viridis]
MSRAALAPAATADATTTAPPGLSRTVLLLLCTCVGLAQSMVAAVNLLIADLAASALHPTQGQLLWAVDAYVIVFAGLLIPAGAFGDRFGRKGALLAGLGVLALGAAVSGAAPTMALVIAGRALCGVGAALIMPATMALVVQLAGPAGRAAALAAWTLALGLGGLAGNLVGGVLAQLVSWRSLFALVTVLAAVLAGLGAAHLPRTARNRAAVLDPLGSALLTVAVLALVDGIIEGPHRGWGSAPVLGAFGFGALLALGFVGYALRAARPLFDPRLFRSPRLRAGVLGTGLSFFGLFALFYVNAQYLQYAKGYSPALTGLAVVPVTVGMILVPRLAARLLPRTGPAPLAVGGLAVLGTGLLLVSTCDAHTAYPLYAAWLVLLSLGTGLCMPTLTITVVAELPVQQAGLGSGLNTAAREIGAALGVALAGSVLATRSTGIPRTPLAVARFTEGMGLGLRVVALALLAGTALVALGYRKRA